MHVPTQNLTWRKSSFSAGAENCVEFAALPDDRIAVRDSKNPDGGTLVLTRTVIRAWMTEVKATEFGVPTM